MNPELTDTDEDSISDGDELEKYNTNPLNKDSDGDGLEDDEEIVLNTDPLDNDSDNDQIADGEEYYIQSVDKGKISSDLFENNDAIPEKILV